MFTLYRVMSRVCVVPFCKPSIAPITDEQDDAFDDIERMIEENLLSQALGWVIKQASTVHNREQLRTMKQKLRRVFQGRCLMNWALVTLTTTKVGNQPLARQYWLQSNNIKYDV